MARRLRGETPPRRPFWFKHRVHPEPGLWHADFPGGWALEKHPADDDHPAGWWVIGTDPWSDHACAEWLGQRIGKAKEWGERFITRPHEREQIRAEVCS